MVFTKSECIVFDKDHKSRTVQSSSSFCWAWVASVRELHRSAKLLENRMAYKVYSLYLTAKCRAQTGKQGEGAGGGGMTCRKWSGVDSNLGYPCCSLWVTRSASWVASEPSFSLVLFQSNRCTLLWATRFHACDPTCDSRPHHWTRMPFSAGLQHFWHFWHRFQHRRSLWSLFVTPL